MMVKKWLLTLSQAGEAVVVLRWTLLFLLIASLGLLSFYSYLLFHSLLELFRVVVVFGIATLAWNARRQIDNPLLVLAGLAFPSIGLLVLAHTLAYKGMGVFPGHDANLPTQLWIAVRGYESLVLFAAVWMNRIKLRIGMLAAAFNLAGVALLWAVFAGHFPDCYVEGIGLTPFKVNAEYAIAVLFALTLALLLRRREILPDTLRPLVAASLVVNILAELAFTRYVSVYGLSNMIGHLLLLLSAYLFYRAVLLKGIQEPQALLFNQLQREKVLLERSEAELAARVETRTQELSDANRRLARELVERKAAEAMRDHLAAIVDSSMDAIVGKGLDGIITSWNHGAEQLYGYRAEEMVGRRINLLAPPELVAQTERLTDRVMAGEPVEDFETERICKDGRRIDVLLSLSPICASDGRIIGVSTIVHDITDRKNAERALVRANAALRLLSASNQTLLHVADERSLLESMCRIVTEVGGYAGAWIGLVENGRLVPRQCSSSALAAHLARLAPDWNETHPEPQRQCMESGTPLLLPEPLEFADGLRLQAVFPLHAGPEVIGCLSLFNAHALDAREVSTLDELAADLSFGIGNLRSKREHEEDLRQLAHIMEDAVRAIAATVEKRDIYTAGHQRRVAELARAIALELGLEGKCVQGIELAAAIHDLGKIHIPAEILTKPARLNSIEMAMMRMHPASGYEILKDIAFPWPIAQTVLQHHERLDGSGYPAGLKGDEIQLEARILAVADMVEAMSSHRPYRPGLGIDAALAELDRTRGNLYDMAAAEACLRLFREKGFRFSDAWGQAGKSQSAADLANA